MFSHLQEITDQSTNQLLKLKREMKHIERSKEDRNRMLQDKRMVFLRQHQAESTSQTQINADTIIQELTSQDPEVVRHMIQTLVGLFDNERKFIAELVEALFDLDILSKLLYHMGSTNHALQTESLYLLSILLSNQSNLFSDSFLRKRGDLMLEQVIGGIYSFESLKHILYCFGNAPSNQLSRAFLDQGIPNLLYNLLCQQPLQVELLSTFSWFLNSCLNINPKTYFDLQFQLIKQDNADLTTEVISNMLIFMGQIDETSEQFNDLKNSMIPMLQHHNLFDHLTTDHKNYVALSETITFLMMLVEINMQNYFLFHKTYRQYIINGLESTKDLVISETIKLLITIGVECRELCSITEHIPQLMKLMQRRSREIKQQGLRFLNYVFIASNEIDSNQFNEFLSFFEQYNEISIEKVLLSMLHDDTELQDKIIETILFFCQKFLSNTRIYSLLQQIGKIKMDEGLLIQTNILYKQM